MLSQNDGTPAIDKPDKQPKGQQASSDTNRGDNNLVPQHWDADADNDPPNKGWNDGIGNMSGWNLNTVIQ